MYVIISYITIRDVGYKNKLSETNSRSIIRFIFHHSKEDTKTQEMFSTIFTSFSWFMSWIEAKASQGGDDYNGKSLRNLRGRLCVKRSFTYRPRQTGGPCEWSHQTKKKLQQPTKILWFKPWLTQLLRFKFWYMCREGEGEFNVLN